MAHAMEADERRPASCQHRLPPQLHRLRFAAASLILPGMGAPPDTDASGLMQTGDKHDPQSRAAATGAPEAALVCPQCAAPLPSRTYEAHLRRPTSSTISAASAAATATPWPTC